MSGQGIFSEDFSLGLGDFLELDDDLMVTPQDPGDDPPDPAPAPPKKKTEPFPSIDGPLSAKEIVAKYKKTLLSKQAMHKDLFDKWSAASPVTGENLALH